MLGAIIGDIVGSRFEFNNTSRTDFDLFTSECSYTDDTICTVAVADAILRGVKYKDSLLAVSIGGDSDTIAAIAGSIAEAYYLIPGEIGSSVIGYMPDDMVDILSRFCAKFPEYGNRTLKTPNNG